VTPLPGSQRDPEADNPIWAAYMPVLRAEHVDVIDIRAAVAGPGGTRVETSADCTGRESRIRPENDIHLTRYGAARTATVIAERIAAIYGRSLDGNRAPGDHTGALVPTHSGAGYWLVGCDGSIYHFGDAPSLRGVRVNVGAPVVGAARTAAGGLWLVTRDGHIMTTGRGPVLSFRAPASEPIVKVAGTPDHRGLVAVTAAGHVLTAGTAREAGDVVGLDAPVVDIATHPTSNGYWMITTTGTVIAFGNARTHGTAPDHTGSPVVGIAPSTTGAGYVLANADGRAFTFGDERAADARKLAPTSTTRPGAAAVAVVAHGGSGYWTLHDNGAVHAFGDAPALGGTSNLALFTP
jgi:hypothetical protein